MNEPEIVSPENSGGAPFVEARQQPIRIERALPGR